ncbi:MAG: TIGR04283 family arsenosugar biosynthesis glycosyltransferase [Terriglobia bacterium]
MVRPPAISPAISIVIPTYNEEAIIGRTLSCLRRLEPGEVIVVDGHSADCTAEIAARQTRVLRQPACRALQMNAGARESSGDVLLFLHADVRLGPGAFEAVRSAMRNPSTVGGNFDARYEGGTLAARAFTRINRWRRRCGIFYGDTGIFCRRSVFESLGGYKPWPILEDYEFVRRLRRAGRLALLDEPIWISDRRWRRSGLLRTMGSWVWIQGLYLAGVPPERLARFYRPVRSDEGPG